MLTHVPEQQKLLPGLITADQFGEAGDHGPLAPETVPPTTSSDTEAVSNRMEGVDQPQRIISLVKDSDVTLR